MIHNGTNTEHQFTFFKQEFKPLFETHVKVEIYHNFFGTKSLQVAKQLSYCMPSGNITNKVTLPRANLNQPDVLFSMHILNCFDNKFFAGYHISKHFNISILCFHKIFALNTWIYSLNLPVFYCSIKMSKLLKISLNCSHISIYNYLLMQKTNSLTLIFYSLI